MDEPYWPIWLIGPLAIATGIVLIIFRDQIYRHTRRQIDRDTFLKKMSVDTFGDSRSLLIPGIAALPIGAFALFFAASRTFGWGYV